MYESEWVAGIGIAGLLVGLLLGIVVGRASFKGRRAKDLEDELETAQTALKDYRAEVYDQFAETARKFESLNTSYNDLHRHLASSASTLLGDGAGTPLLRGPSEGNDPSTIDSEAETLAQEETAPDDPATAESGDASAAAEAGPEADSETAAQSADEPAAGTAGETSTDQSTTATATDDADPDTGPADGKTAP